MSKSVFTSIHLLRTAMLAATVALILLIIPRADHQSFSYELNQPWKYPLLTAPFDMPILRDSASVNALRDSIDRNFVPFVKRSPATAEANIDRFGKLISGKVAPADAHQVTHSLQMVFARGVVDSDVYASIHSGTVRGTVRMADTDTGSNAVATADASAMLSPAKAFRLIDSLYVAGAGSADARMPAVLSKALNICLTPNIVTDTAADNKYRSQEYLNVTGAQGVIKKGQRIVDRGEIVTPQIFTNLDTYQEMLERQQDQTRTHTYFTIGQGCYILVCLVLLYLFLSIYRPPFFNDLRKMSFLMSFITLFVIFAIVLFEYFSNGIYLVPFAIVPVTIMVFFDSRTAIFSLLTTVLISALVATFPFQFIFMEIAVGLVATFSIRQLSRRSQLLRSAAIVFVTYCVTYFAVCLVTEGNLHPFTWRVAGVFAINAVFVSFAYIIIVVIEKVFGFTSTVTLVELSDINSPMLRRLAEEAPGTFQHSMQVSTLASEAARAIGANTQLVRTGALYHDIGKLESPVFFTENQHGANPHAGLDPRTSARKIISHVAAGLQLAAKEKLPSVIRDFISEHHGKGMARFFYNTAVNDNPGKEIDKTDFTYPGPNPQSKETAILMMADAVEAASRSLKDYSEQSIGTLVDRIIDSQASEGLFKDSPISFADVETVKATFKKRLATIYHSRIAYPEINRAPAAAGLKKDKPDTAPNK